VRAQRLQVADRQMRGDLGDRLGHPRRRLLRLEQVTDATLGCLIPDKPAQQLSPPGRLDIFFS
jgi:hypothetical protein